MIELKSKDNANIKYASGLMTGAAERRKSGKIICEGARLCLDAVKSGIEGEKLFCTASAIKKYGEYIKEIEGKSKESYLITDEAAAKIGNTVSTQGIFLTADRPYVETDTAKLVSTGRYVLLENLQDPANVGAIFRTAEALGINGVILTDGTASCFSPKAMRAGMGAMFRIPIFHTHNAVDTVTSAAGKSMRPMAAVPDQTASDITAVRFFHGAIMCVGNEGNGLSDELIAACPERVVIPMAGGAESLNAAVAASILMWEMVRGYKI